MLFVLPVTSFALEVGSANSRLEQIAKAQSPGCGVFFTMDDRDGHWSCYLVDEDDEWCYYTCYNWG
ncbi:MAG: hypothetical protein ACK5NT_08925 [Pyrinomonadaceae bacterium]